VSDDDNDPGEMTIEEAKRIVSFCERHARAWDGEPSERSIWHKTWQRARRMVDSCRVENVRNVRRVQGVNMINVRNGSWPGLGLTDAEAVNVAAHLAALVPNGRQQVNDLLDAIEAQGGANGGVA